MIKVAGLHTSITNEEILELFSSVGKLKKCCINYDSLGRSKGTANIKYEQYIHAQRAIRKYNSNIIILLLIY